MRTIQSRAVGGCGASPSAGGPSCRCSRMHTRVAWVLSHFLELTVFFAAAAALGAGLLGLR